MSVRHIHHRSIQGLQRIPARAQQGAVLHVLRQTGSQLIVLQDQRAPTAQAQALAHGIAQGHRRPQEAVSRARDLHPAVREVRSPHRAVALHGQVVEPRAVAAEDAEEALAEVSN